MGNNTPSIEYAVPISSPNLGQTAVYRSPQFKDGFIYGPTENSRDLKTAIISSFEKHAQKQCLGAIVKQEGQKDKIEFTTYGEIFRDAVEIGSGIIHEKLQNQQQLHNYKLIGIFSKNRKQWTIVDIACVLFRVTTVPLYDTLGEQGISHILKSSSIKSLFVNDSSLKVLMKSKFYGDLKNIISFDKFTEEQQSYFKGIGIALRQYKQIQQIGKNNLKDYKSEQFKVSPKDCVTFAYTSGTTGPPKGAMISHENFSALLGAVASNKDTEITSQDISLSYLPLPHVLERQYLYLVLTVGGKSVYSSGDPKKIKDDLQLVKPTVFVAVPLIYNRFYEAINGKFNTISGKIKAAIDYALKSKIQTVSTKGIYTHKIYDKIFFKRTKAALGGNVKLMISGSAPLLPQIQKFMKVTMCAPLMEGYGQTESTGGCFITASEDPNVGYVGGPASNAEFKLVDIPEMKYTSKDTDENGQLRPRGEIWLRGPCVFLGYYKNEQITKETITEDGWLKTGDVGAILPGNNALKIIDRKKNIFKLSQGEYVASEKVENVYINYNLISQIFLYGESSQSYAVVIIVPHRHLLQQKAKLLDIQTESYEQLCKNKQIRLAVITEMNVIGRKKGLKGFQLARNIFIEPTSFEVKKILTNTLKIQRHQAKLAYKEEIQAMYKQGKIQQSSQSK